MVVRSVGGKRRENGPCDHRIDRWPDSVASPA